jgi:aspartate 1-decarboxylase
LTISLFRYTGSIKADFKNKEAGFIAKTGEYKSQLELLQATIDQKTMALATADTKTKEIERQIILLREESDKIRAEFDGERKNFQKRSLELKERLDKYETASIENLIKQALEKEENAGVKRLLEDSVARVEMLRESKAVDLEPIVVTKDGAVERVSINVVALDKKNKLIAINAGRNDRIKEGDRLIVMRDGKELVSAQVVAVRYRVATAFVDQNRHNFSMKDIREGDEVVRGK